MVKEEIREKKFECYAFNSIQLLIKLKKEKIKPLISKLKKIRFM